MPFNGSGTFSRLYSWVVDAANSIDILSTRMDAEMNGFAAGLTNCITRDGQSPPSADLPMGGKKLTNLGAAAAGTDALNRDTADARYLLSASALPHTLTFNNAGSGAASGAVFDVTASITISYNTLGAAPLASPAFTGTPAAPTAAPGTNTTQLATTAFVTAAIPSLAAYAPLASPTFTGTPAAPTASAGTATTQLATTAFADALRDVTSNAQTGAYPLALTDRGKVIPNTTGGWAIPANASVAFPIGTVIFLYNNSGSPQSIVITTDNLFLDGANTSGTRTLAAYSMGYIHKPSSAATWVAGGKGMS